MNILRSRWFTHLFQGISLALISFWLVASLGHNSLAIQIQDISDPRQTPGQWVMDRANLLNPATEAQLNAQISQFEAQTTAEIVVVTVPDTEGYTTPKAFTTELFNIWGIGKAETNNGVLFMVSLGDRRTEIETGIGSQEILTDEYVQAIVDNQVIPNFKAGDFNQGIVAGTVAIMQGLDPNAAPAMPVAPATPGSSTPTRPGQTTSLVSESNPLRGWFILSGSLLGLGGMMGWLARQTARAPNYIPPTGRTTTPPDDSIMVYLLLWLSALSLGLAVVLPSLLWWGWQSQTILIIAAITGLVLSWPVYSQLHKRLTQHLQIAHNQDTLHLVHCANCRDRLYPLDPQALRLILSEPQKVAKKLGTTKYKAWHCPMCVSEIALDQVYLVAIAKQRYDFSECPTCQEFTVKDTKRVITKATYSHSGEGEKTRKCQCCDFEAQERYTIPQKEREDDHHSSSSFASSSSGSSGSSSSSSSSSDGGSSSGGGGGGSW